MQALAAAEGAGSEDSAQAALAQVEALLAADGAPFSSRLQGARATLLLQLRRWGFQGKARGVREWGGTGMCGGADQYDSSSPAASCRACMTCLLQLRRWVLGQAFKSSARV